jgi:hypothetical protein
MSISFFGRRKKKDWGDLNRTQRRGILDLTLGRFGICLVARNGGRREV